MTIGRAARRAGVRASTIRYHERLALLPAPVRVSRQRRYDETILERLAIIRFARYVGFTLAEVGRLLQGPDVRPPTDRWRRMADLKIRDLGAAIQHAETLKQLLRDTLSHQCPHLVEHGTALAGSPDGVDRSRPTTRGDLSAPRAARRQR